MILEDARRMAQEDADKYQVEIYLIYDKLEEYKTADDGQDNCYSFCAVAGMDIMYPPHLKDFWKILGIVKPR